MKIHLLFPCAAVCWAGMTLAGAAILDPNFNETLYANAGYGLTGIAWAPDGSNRLFVTHKEGYITIVKNGVPLPASFASISPLYTGSECGLLGICFDPNFM